MFALTTQDIHGVAYVNNATKQGYDVAHEGDSIVLAFPDSKNRRGRVGKGVAQTLDTGCKQGVLQAAPELGGVYTGDSPDWHKSPLPGLSRCLKANNHDAGITDGFRIRKLTPLECWRLQGFPDDLFYKARKVNSDNQLYKQAGNSITVNVVHTIAKRLKELEPIITDNN
jgi:DNA (cytosine-5)-methyltransferase 1